MVLIYLKTVFQWAALLNSKRKKKFTKVCSFAYSLKDLATSIEN